MRVIALQTNVQTNKIFAVDKTTFQCSW